MLGMLLENFPFMALNAYILGESFSNNEFVEFPTSLLLGLIASTLVFGMRISSAQMLPLLKRRRKDFQKFSKFQAASELEDFEGRTSQQRTTENHGKLIENLESWDGDIINIGENQHTRARQASEIHSDFPMSVASSHISHLRKFTAI